jgi:hypothetical protein
MHSGRKNECAGGLRRLGAAREDNDTHRMPQRFKRCYVSSRVAATRLAQASRAPIHAAAARPPEGGRAN